MNNAFNRAESLLNSVAGQNLVILSKEKRLVEYAADDPLFVLKRIFTKGQLQNIKEYSLKWFHVALCVDLVMYEDGECRSSLLAFFNEVQRLIDALYILHTHHEQPDKKATDPTFLEELRSTPLLSAEMLDPLLTVKRFFSKFSIEHCRRELWDWKHAGISYGPPYPDNINEVQVLYTYQDIECLIEAAYSLYLREQQPPEEIGQGKISIESTNEIVAGIVELCKPDKIFNLMVEHPGYSNEFKKYHFLILLPGDAYKSYVEYESMIENKFPGIDIIIIFKKTADAYRYLEQGYIFYTILYEPGKLIYDASGEPLPAQPKIDIQSAIHNATSKFEDAFRVAESFLNGARYYCVTEQPNTAAFLLHQVAEHSLRALLHALLGPFKYEHSLKRLINRCSLCAPEIIKLFPQHTEKEKDLFHLLNTAYSDSRYKSSYTISMENAMRLLERVEQLQTEVQQFFNESIISFKTLHHTL